MECKYEGKIAEIHTDVKNLIKGVDNFKSELREDLKAHYATKEDIECMKGDIKVFKWATGAYGIALATVIGVLRMFQ